MLMTLLMRAIATAGAKKLVILILEVLVKRTDNKIDDALVRIVREVMDGDVSSIKKSKLKA